MKTKFFVVFVLFFILTFSQTNAVFYQNTSTFKTDQISEINKTELPSFFQEIEFPGNFPSFLFGFIFTLPFAYTLYLAGVGFLAVLITFLGTGGDKQETKKAFYGFLVGLVLGIGIKLLIMGI